MKIGLIESNYQTIQCNSKRGLRSSPRLQSLYKKGILNPDKSIINDISSTFNIQKSVRSIEHDIKENAVPSEGYNAVVLREEIKGGSKASLHIQDFRIMPHTHLPLKKRFRNFSERKCLSDIQNFNNNNNNNSVSDKAHVGYMKTSCMNSNGNEVKIHNLNLAQIDEQQRAFISQIDFDELNAIINLKYLKQYNH
jgi:hypothetical protein